MMSIYSAIILVALLGIGVSAGYVHIQVLEDGQRICMRRLDDGVIQSFEECYKHFVR